MKNGLRKLKALALIATIAVLPGMTSTSSTYKPLTEYKLIQSMHASASEQRARVGLPTQQLDEELCKQAQRWANNMANRNSMYHGGGEQVIAYGYSSPQQCIQGWINSPAHRAWVLGRNGRCGFGVQRSWSGQWYYAGVFR